MKKDRTKELFLEQLRQVPIVEVAAQQVGVARSTVYKWRAEDEEFRRAMEDALTEGEARLNDLGENQLYALMLDKHWSAIQFWLRHRNPKFKDKLEVSGTITTKKEMTPEQQAQALEALERSARLRAAIKKDETE